MTTRRAFITGLVSFVAAPAIVRAGSLMPVKVMEPRGILYRAISVDEMLERMINPPIVYGRSPMQQLLPDLDAIRAMLERRNGLGYR